MPVLLVIIGIPFSWGFLRDVTGKCDKCDIVDEGFLMGNYRVPVVGHIVGGFNTSLPVFHFPTNSKTDGTNHSDTIITLVRDSILIAIVGWAFTLSMAKTIAKELNYSLDGNQELFAEVFENMFAFQAKESLLTYDAFANLFRVCLTSLEVFSVACQPLRQCLDQ